MSEEDVARKMKEMQEELLRQADEMDKEKASRKKTKKQLEREEKEKKLDEARKKNIGTIYKQLAKTFHPDLETDNEQKLYKEELMKQLTVAYENNDLHTLLKLEMQWLKKEEDNIDGLTDDKLGIYNEVLQEQVRDAEMELDVLIRHPRYLHLQRFADEPSELTIKILEKEKSKMGNIIRALEKDEMALQGKDALRHVKNIINEFKQPPVVQDYDMDDLLKEFLKLKR